MRGWTGSREGRNDEMKKRNRSRLDVSSCLVYVYFANNNPQADWRTTLNGFPVPAHSYRNCSPGKKDIEATPEGL